jgi:hypothetical protein
MSVNLMLFPAGQGRVSDGVTGTGAAAGIRESCNPPLRGELQLLAIMIRCRLVCWSRTGTRNPRTEPG